MQLNSHFFLELSEILFSSNECEEKTIGLNNSLSYTMYVLNREILTQTYQSKLNVMAQSQCRRSVGDNFGRGSS